MVILRARLGIATGLKPSIHAGLVVILLIFYTKSKSKRIYKTDKVKSSSIVERLITKLLYYERKHMDQPKILTETEIKQLIKLLDALIQQPQSYGVLIYYNQLRATKNKLLRMVPYEPVPVVTTEKISAKDASYLDFLNKIIESNKDPDL